MSDDGSERGPEEWNGDGNHSRSIAPSSTVTANLNTTFELLSNARRRYLLYYLVTMDGSVVDVDATVDAVATTEAAGSETDAQPTREDIEIALQHRHLPRLAKAGIVDYDPHQKTIRYTGHPAFEEWVEHTWNTEVK